MIQISHQEYKKLSTLIHEHFGIDLGENKKSLVTTRLFPLMQKKGFQSFEEYYQYLLQDKTGKALLNLANHITTNYSFFYREGEHFDFLQDVALPYRVANPPSVNGKNIHFWSAGCSSGEEAYTLSMVIQDFFEKSPSWDLGIFASDIDTNVLQQANQGTYLDDRLRNIPPLMKTRHFQQSSTGDWQIHPRIKDLVHFSRFNLIRPTPFQFQGKFFAIFCRNVMIYFNRSTVNELVRKLYEVTEEDGYLFIGLTETLDKQNCPFHYVAPSIYQKRTEKGLKKTIAKQAITPRRASSQKTTTPQKTTTSQKTATPQMAISKPISSPSTISNPSTKTRVLVVDDSSLVREILSEGLSKDPQILVVGSAPDPYAARGKIAELKPDVLTLDVEMPRMDGVQFLRHMMPQFPLPVVMVSALTGKGQQLTLDALEAGAVDFVTKPSVNVSRGLEEMLQEIREKVKMAAHVDVNHWKAGSSSSPSRISSIIAPKALAISTNKVIAIGASTGGVEAISRVLKALPATLPGIVIVQHMPPGFTKSYSDRLNQNCAMEVKEAESGDHVSPGKVLIAPGDQHMEVHRSGGNYIVTCYRGEKVSRHCPSVEVLFRSVAKYVGANAVGIILTGMGNDGAEGMLAMRQAGAKTLAQDEKSCVVFGMPKEAHRLGGVEQLVSLNKIPDTLVQLLKK